MAQKRTDKQITHSIWMRGQQTRVVNEILALIDEAWEDIISRISRSRLQSNAHLLSLIDSLVRVQSELSGRMQSELIDELVELARLEAGWQERAIVGDLAEAGAASRAMRAAGSGEVARRVASVRVIEGAAKSKDLVESRIETAGMSVLVSKDRLRAIATEQAFVGKTLGEWLEDQADSTVKEVRRQLRLGMAAGENQDQIVRRIRGTHAAGYKDGVMAASRRNVETIVRTASSAVRGEIDRAVIARHSDRIKWVQFSAVLDGRTSPVCRATDGRKWRSDDPKLIIPPLHPNCRSIVIPIFEDGVDEIDETYAQWLERQTAAEQRAILGSARYKLWRSGEVTLDRFIDSRGHQKPLAQLARDEGITLS